MRLALLFAVALTGCGPKEILVDLNLTVTNQSGWDFISTDLCFYDEDGTEACSVPFALDSGSTLLVEDSILVLDGDMFDVDAAAVDTDGDVWYLAPRSYVVGGPSLDISILFTENDCCF